MPRNVRNFWLDCDIDGKARPLSGGPQSREGGFSLRIRQRSGGCVTEAARVDGFADAAGNLALRVTDANGAEVWEHVTHRVESGRPPPEDSDAD